jgi:hypothetical protein
MKTISPKWWRIIASIIFAFFFLIGGAGCAGIKTEARIRHYFGLAPHEPLNSANIQSALLLQFPVGTPSVMVEASLTERGVGKDGKSTMWRPESNKWWTGNALCCGPNDYEHAWLSTFPMRHITVCFDLNEQQKVKQINVEIRDYGL